MATQHNKAAAKDGHSFDESECTVKVFDSFEQMGLDQPLIRGVYSYGFEKPSAIQQRAIVPFIGGGDIIAQAQSGTGKTGAFSIGLLQRMDWTKKCIQGIVLTPTRELAMQTFDVMVQLGDFIAEAHGHPHFCMTLVGGTAVAEDRRKLDAGAVVAVGTPGRIVDVMKRGLLKPQTLKAVVLDEADEMLQAGFLDQVYSVFKFLPKEIQLALFSATMPQEVLELVDNFMRDPTRILVKKECLTLEAIKQFYVAVEEDQKLDTLMDLYESFSVAQSIIFCNSRRRVDWLAEEMNKQNFTVASLHAEMQKAEREKVMAEFRRGTVRVLITTNLLCRGIDVQHVNVVINFELPVDNESYLHRVGRVGRFGRKGLAINFVSSRAVSTLKGIEEFYHTKVDELPNNFAEELDS